ncbi:hypothetical protein E2320_018500 [Naja naja]|nr:hypothetical protein E2320_018500 [Naja naja]
MAKAGVGAEPPPPLPPPLPPPAVQKELVYNKLLPYGDKLEAEASYLLAQIKLNLSRAVQLQELWPGGLFWTRKLSTYLRLYGRKFSKEDHVLFIKLLYELVTIPKLEISMMQGFARLLINLLKKKELLSRDDLELPWRPLYEMLERILYSKTEHLGLNWFPNSCRPGLSSPKTFVLNVLHRCSVESVLKTLVKNCRLYFPESATAEMLDEWRPLMCPFDVTMQKAITYFELFLPTTLPPECHHKGFKNSSLHLVNLFARLATDNIGYINWDPYIPKIFTRILRSLNLPVGSNQMMVPRFLTNAYDIGHAVMWITAMMNKLMKLLQRLPSSIVRRLHRERYKKTSWLTPVPDSHKLSDQDITEFVECIIQPVLLAMFSKTGSLEAAQALQNLALMRPETYPALETLTEPHQLTATLSCVIGVARSLVSGGKSFPEGPTHMLPLLMRALPGVDPNDFSKCMITFQFIATFSTLVPLVDCSSVLQERNDLTEVERELCSATAEFEDFVLQFMDRQVVMGSRACWLCDSPLCFGLIESSTLEQTREETETEKMTHLESLVELGLSSTYNTILTQCSKDIFKVALDKVFNFAVSNIFETRVAGRMVADMCRAAVKCCPEKSLKLFVPHCCNVITHLTLNDDVLRDEELDKELLWNLQLLSEITRVDGKRLLPYREQLLKILQRTLHLTCKQGYILSCNLLHHLLRSTTLIYPTEYCSVPGGFDKPVSEYFPIKARILTFLGLENLTAFKKIKDWGKPGNLQKLDIQWHVPSAEEVAFAFELLDTFLQPEINKLERYSDGSLEMSRDDVQQCLTIVHNCLIGSGNMLPPLKGEKVAHMVPSLVSLEEIKLYTGVEYGKFVERELQERICKVTRKLLHFVLDNSEDDTKSLFLIIKIIGDLLHFQGSHKHEFDSRWKSFNLVKKSMENRLQGKKQHIRALLIDRVMLQHELRTLTVEGCEYKKVHQNLIRDLLRLSTSSYGQVRNKAQQAFFTALGTYNFCCRDIIPLVLEFLRPDEYSVTQQQFKVPETCIEVAVLMQKSVGQNGECTSLSSEEIELGIQRQKERNAESSQNYENLVNKLLDCVNQRNLPWKFEHIGIGFLSLLLRDDRVLPVRAINFFVECLNHDVLVVRKMAISAVAGILKQLKRPHKKMLICPYQISGSPQPSNIQAGDRSDNQWLHYESANLPKTKQSWEACHFVEKTHWGYYTWPQNMEIYASVEEQPKLGRSRKELSEAEQVIYDHFSDPNFVEQLIKFLSLEDRKGKDKFNPRRFCLFKGLFRNFDDTFLPVLKPHLERLAEDSHESPQRCVAEIIAGLIRGSKHWTFEKVENLWKVLCPLLRTALSNITVETYNDWGTCIATSCESRDPRKLHWLFELLLESPLNGEGGSFVDACRLYVLQGGLAQQEWRVPELLHRLLKYLEPKLTQVYKNVRERIGSVLTYIFMIDISLPNTALTKSPRVHDFTSRILEKLKPLMEVDEEIQNHVLEENGIGDEDERTQGIKLLKTILKWLMASAGRAFSTAVTEQLQLLPLFFKIAPVENDHSYDELKRDAKMCLSLMSQGLLYPQQVPLVLQVLKQIAKSNSWHARYTVLTYLQTMVFYNLFIFLNNEEAVNNIRWLVIKLLEDEQLEDFYGASSAFQYPNASEL